MSGTEDLNHILADLVSGKTVGHDRACRLWEYVNDMRKALGIAPPLLSDAPSADKPPSAGADVKPSTTHVSIYIQKLVITIDGKPT